MLSGKKIVVFLLLVHFLLAFSSALRNSQTYDESVNLASGYHYLTTGSVRLNPEHPPLVDTLAALPLLFLKIDPPRKDWQGDTQRWTNAADFLYRNRAGHRVLLMLGRIPMILLSVLLGLGVYLLGKRLFGPGAGLAALFLYVFCPNILANASLVSHDIGLSAMVVLTALFAWDYFQTGRLRPFVFTGVFLGLALMSKFTALVLGPIFLFWFLFREFEYRGRQVPGFLPERLGEGRSAGFGQVVRVGLEMGLLVYIAGMVILCFYRLHLGDISWGISYGLSHQIRGNRSFLLGEYSRMGWWYYFPVAFALKTPVPTLLLILGGVFQVRKGAWLQAGFWLVPALVIFYCGAFTTINIGLRYVLPAYPFLLIGAGAALAWCLRGKRIFKFAGTALMAWLLIANLRIYPHYLAYFNELAGGPEKGVYLLNDSNIDWGQDLIGLREYLDRRGVNELYLAYAGSCDPADWGIQYQYLPSCRYLSHSPDYRVKGPLELVAISATYLQGIWDDRAYRWFWGRPPVARIGYSIYVYDITGSAEAHEEIRKIYEQSDIDWERAYQEARYNRYYRIRSRQKTILPN